MTQTSEASENAAALPAADQSVADAGAQPLPPLRYLRELAEWLRDLPWLLSRRGRTVELELADGRPLAGTLKGANLSGLTLRPPDTDADVVVARDAIAEGSLDVAEAEVEAAPAQEAAAEAVAAPAPAPPEILTTISYRRHVALDASVRANLAIAAALAVVTALVY